MRNDVLIIGSDHWKRLVKWVCLTWTVLAGLTGCSPDGVSARMWKCDVGGGPMGVGRLSASTW